MYVVLLSNQGLPVVINTNDLNYPDYIQSGNYVEHYNGTKKECEAVLEEILIEFE